LGIRTNPLLDGVELIVVDNLSTLCRTGKESEGKDGYVLKKHHVWMKAI